MNAVEFEALYAELLRLYGTFGFSHRRPRSRKPRASVIKRIHELASMDDFVTRLIERTLASPNTPQGDFQIFSAETVLHDRKHDPIVFKSLIEALSSRSKRRRHVAAHLIFTLAPEEAGLDLINVGARTRDPLVLDVCLQISHMFSHANLTLRRRLLALATKAVRSCDRMVKHSAYESLAQFAPAKSGMTILRAAKDSDPFIRAYAEEWYKTWSNRHNLRSKKQ